MIKHDRSPDPFRWLEGKRVAVSLSFDDARPSQLDLGLPILDRHGIRATFYVTLKNVEPQQSRWREAASGGHEMGNHSLNHACSGNFGWGRRRCLEEYTLQEMEDELIEANARLTEIFGVPPRTFAYPCGQTFVGRGVHRRSYVPAVAKHFLAGRGFRDEYTNDPVFCDLTKVGGMELDRLSLEALVATTKKAAERGAWVVFAGHEVGNGNTHQMISTETLDRYCAWCRDEQNEVWIDTVETIAKFVKRNRPE